MASPNLVFERVKFDFINFFVFFFFDLEMAQELWKIHSSLSRTLPPICSKRWQDSRSVCRNCCVCPCRCSTQRSGLWLFLGRVRKGRWAVPSSFSKASAGETAVDQNSRYSFSFNSFFFFLFLFFKTLFLILILWYWHWVYLAVPLVGSEPLSWAVKVRPPQNSSPKVQIKDQKLLVTSTVERGNSFCSVLSFFLNFILIFLF